MTDQQLADILATGNLAAGASIGFNTTSIRTYANASAPQSGQLGLVKLGTATLALAGTNTHTITITTTTTVAQGTLSIASTAALPG